MAGAQQLPNGIVVSHQKLKGRRNNTMLSYKGSDGYEVLRRCFLKNLNPILTRLCHVIYCHGDKRYPCLVGIGLDSCLSGLKFVASEIGVY